MLTFTALLNSISDLFNWIVGCFRPDYAGAHDVSTVNPNYPYDMPLVRVTIAPPEDALDDLYATVDKSKKAADRGLEKKAAENTYSTIPGPSTSDYYGPIYDDTEPIYECLI